MPVNKNALLRYRILDRCFSDRHHYYDIDELLDKVNEAFLDIYGKTVSLRQIRADISYMKDRVFYDAPIEAIPYDGKKCYYRYSDPDFSIFNSDLSNEEVEKLRTTIEMLGRFRGIPGNAWLEEVISNLEYRFGVKSNNDNIVAFDQNSQLKGIEYLSELIDSAVNHTPLKIIYKTFSGTEKTRIVHPYHLKEYNNRWFLFGLQESDKHENFITNMALDRIVSFSRPSNIAFIPNNDIDFSTRFKDVVGVTIPEDHPEVEEVLLKFDPARFPYIVSKPIHSSQKIVNEEEYTLSLNVRPNKELEAQIFSFGHQVEVLKPEWLRQQIAGKIAETYKKYFPVQKGCTDKM